MGDSSTQCVDESTVLVDKSDSRPLVLVIDDSADMRLFITELLKDDYRVIRAANGKEGV